MATAMTGHHRGLDRALETIIARCECEDHAVVREAWESFEQALLRHIEIEERDLLPLFARSCPNEAADLSKDHEHIRRELLELGVALDLHQLRLEAVRDLASRLRAHAAREDLALYPWLEKHLPAEAWQTLGLDLPQLTANTSPSSRN